MKHQNKRKCSLCRAPGHTRRACINAKKERARARSVVIRFAGKTKRSPHLIDLRHQQPVVWRDVHAFFEAPPIAARRATVDFGAMVRQGSQQRRQAWRRYTEKIECELKAVEKKIVKKAMLSPYSRLIQWYTGSGIDFNRSNVRLSASGGTREECVQQLQQTPLGSSVTPFLSTIQGAIYRLSLPRRAVAGTIAILLVVTLPFPAWGYYRQVKNTTAFVAAESATGFRALQSSTAAAFQADIAAAENDLQTALESFGKVNSIMHEHYGNLLSFVAMIPVIGEEVESRQQLLLAGHHLALGNAYLIKGIRAVDDAQMSATERMALLRRHVVGALPQYEEALVALQHIQSGAVPSEYQQIFADFRLLFATFIDDIRDAANLARVFHTIFGGEGRKRYLLVFQNNHELRPTGGFIGSFARLDVEKGKIVSLEFPGGGPYDLKGQLTEFVKPPLPLQLVNSRWEFQDANWWPDFSASAEKMMWFYEHARGQTVDGVIAVNGSVLPRMLKVLGPTASAQFDTLLDHELVLNTLQEKVETGYDKEKNNPKEAVGKLFEELLAAIPTVSANDLLGLLTEVHEAVRQKEIQLYISDVAVQSGLREFGWTGEIVPTNANQDYLLVAMANMQGQKSDAKMEQEILHEAAVADDGSVIDTVIIKRSHKGTVGEKFYGAPNISYLRAYVPEGAELLSAGGFSYPPEDAFRVPETWYNNDPHLLAWEKDEGVHVGSGTHLTREFDKTVFGNWVITNPGETSEVFFRYRLPFKVDMSAQSVLQSRGWRSVLASAGMKETSRYSLVAQKQSGTDPKFFSRIIYPESWTPIWKSDERMDLALNGAEIETEQVEDMAIGIVLQREAR